MLGSCNGVGVEGQDKEEASKQGACSARQGQRPAAQLGRPLHVAHSPQSHGASQQCKRIINE